MSTEDIVHFDFYDMRAACRKYKENDLNCTNDEEVKE